MQDSSNLQNKTITGLFWSFADLFANRGIQFILQIMLARLLRPEHFGLVGIILIFIAISETIVNSGFSQSLIRDNNTNQDDYSTVFYFNLLVSTSLYILFYFSAGQISIFFGETELVIITRILALVIVIKSLEIIPRVMLVKKVDFKTITKTSVIANITSGVITIITAVAGFGVWSLVINMMVLQIIQTLLLLIYNRWLPSLAFNIRSFKKHFKFGSKLLVAGLLDTAYINVYFMIIGRLYSTTELGLFTHAMKFRDLATHSISTAAQRVSYPVLSSIQEDQIRIIAGCRRIIKLFAFLNFPLMIGLAVIAKPLFIILFGEQWLPSVIYFQLLCIAGMIAPLHAFNLTILQVKGRTDLFLLLEVVNKVISSILIVITISCELGIFGLIWTAIISSYTSLFINTYFSAKEIAYSLKEQFHDLLLILIISVVMGVIVYFIGTLVHTNPILKMICQIGISIFLYFVLCKKMKIEEVDVLRDLIFTFIKRNKYTTLK